MHQLSRADDGVHGAGSDAQRAADAGGLVDPGDHDRSRFTPGQIQW